MITNPNICSCGSQLFTQVWSVEAQGDESDENLDPKQGNTVKKPVGFECVECGELQLTREVPQRHADDNALGYPSDADRDMVQEAN
jgi:hypothetical protein